MRSISKLVKWSKRISLALLVTIFSVGMAFSAPDNSMYKQWCEDTFYNGDKIYEAYKVINFDIHYKGDVQAGYFDYWQKGRETLQLKTGDCEDFMILFSDLLPWDYESFDIVWGFIYSKTSKSKTKHVWGELRGKSGQLYILEGGQQDWGGIQKVETIEIDELRDPIVVLPQQTYTLLQEIFLKYDYFDQATYQEIFGKSEPSSEAFRVFEMLHEMITRYSYKGEM